MEIHEDSLIFRSGKRIYAHSGTVGIDSYLEITEGYDGGVDLEQLTHAECRELAVHMIRLWMAFFDKHEEE